jgi:hypothetical protein
MYVEYSELTLRKRGCDGIKPICGTCVQSDELKVWILLTEYSLFANLGIISALGHNTETNTHGA